MDLLTKLERKFGKFAIPNLTVILIAGFILGYMIEIVAPEAIGLVGLNPEKIIHGEIWRLFTWVVIPPRSLSVFVILTLMFYYFIGRTLEESFGEFRYTLYVMSGILFTDLGILLTYLVLLFTNSEYAGSFALSSEYTSTYYLCMSLYLAYAFLFPDRQVLLYFIIPVKVKWLGYLYIAYLIFAVLQCGLFGDYPSMIVIITSVLNYIVFYCMMKSKRRLSPAHRKRKRTYRQEVRQTQILTRHKCAICGQTEEDNPSLEFRYCSRCKGNYEYCNNHLFTHEHKK